MNSAHPSYSRHGNEDDLLRLQSRATQSSDAVSITDSQGVIVYANPAFEAMTGYVGDTLVGSTHTLVKSGLHARPFYDRLWSVLREGREFRSVFVNRRKNGDLYHEEKLIRPFIDAQGHVTHFVSVGRDVSNALHAIQRMQYLATHDLLTGLPNRALFEDRMRGELGRAGRVGGGFTLCFIDVDKLKPVNDLHGHSAGDALLRTVAKALQDNVRETDTVARLSGDEFGLILAGASRRKDAQEALAKIFDALRREVAGLDGLPNPSISVGACLYPQDSDDGRQLLIRADQAMYRAKSAGGDRYCFFDPLQDSANTSQLGAALAAEGENARLPPFHEPNLLSWSKLTADPIDFSNPGAHMP
jgi:diguanylate cyclase (GGDEF)-like protein/PAS domain S-box-containing protein